MNDFLNPKLLLEKLGGRNLFLVGMMGSGKSRSGPLLAKELSYGFVDIDQVIEEVAKKSISKIFEDDGEITFREIETHVLKEVGKRHSLVVATGGGVVIKSENWGILHQGVVIWIDPGRDTVVERLKSDISNNRPLLKNNLEETFDSLLKERRPLYLESDLHLSVEKESPIEVTHAILKNLQLLLNQNQDGVAQQTITFAINNFILIFR